MTIEKKENLFLFEQKACRRFVFYRNEKYFISIPPIRFRLNYEKLNGKYFFKTLFGFIFLNGKYFNIPLRNINNAGVICLGSILSEDVICDNAYDLIHNSMNIFWKSSFEDCAFGRSHRLYKEKGKFICSLQLWEEKTKEDKNWVPSEEDLIEFNEKNNGSSFSFKIIENFKKD